MYLTQNGCGPIAIRMRRHDRRARGFGPALTPTVLLKNKVLLQQTGSKGVAHGGSKDGFDKFVDVLEAKKFISLYFRQGGELLVNLVGNVGRDDARLDKRKIGRHRLAVS